MARPKKQTVDYFPHQSNHGKTMFILEQRYGNDGYAFWFKLLEQLGSTNGHVIDCKDVVSRGFLCAKSRVTEEVAMEMLDLLSDMGAIDCELWSEEGVIWSQNFVDGIADAYRNRKVDLPTRPSLKRKEHGENKNNLQGRHAPGGVYDVRNTQTKLNETKLNETKLKAPGAKTSAFVLPEWIPKEPWDGFEEMRRKIKKPMTDRARENIVKKLAAFRQRGHDPTAVLDQSITSGWQDVYEPKQEGGNGSGEKYKSVSERKVERNEQVRLNARALLGIPGGSNPIHHGLPGDRAHGRKAPDVPEGTITVPKVEIIETG